MSVEARIREKDRESRENIADLDRMQHERASKRQTYGKLAGDILSSVGKVAAAGIAANDPSWYKKFGYEKYVTSLPRFVNKSVGVPGTMYGTETISNNGPKTFVKLDSRHTIPTVVAFPYYCHIGRCSETIMTEDTGESPSLLGSASDYPINAAMMRTLTELGKVNSRTVPVDPSVAAFYFLAVVDIYALLARLATAIKVCEHFSNVDSWIPHDILVAMGMSPTQVSTFRNTLAQWRTVYEEMSSRVNTLLPLPYDLSLAQRRIWLATTIIKSSDSSLSPYMLFQQLHYGIINDVGTEYQYNYAIGSLLNTTTTFRNSVEQMINRVILNEYEATFIANMRAAIPESKFMKLSNLDSYKFDFTSVNDEVRLIMQNLEMIPNDVSPASNPRFGGKNALTVWHDDDGVLFQSSWFDTSSSAQSPGDPKLVILEHAVNAFKPISDDDILVATRLKNNYGFVNGGVYCTTCGTEIVAGGIIYYRDDSSISSTPSTYVLSSLLKGSVVRSIVLAEFVKVIDGCPRVALITETVNSSNQTITYDVWHLEEVDKYIPVSDEVLTRLEYMCLQSLYHLDSSVFARQR